MQSRTRQILVLFTTLIFIAGLSAACGDSGDDGENGGNGNNGEAVGAGYTGCDGLPEVEDMAEGPELDESYLDEGVYEISDIETAARIQNIEVIPGTLRISDDAEFESFFDTDNQLECLKLPNLEVVEGSIRGRDRGMVGGAMMPAEITFENLTTVEEDFSFAHLEDNLQRINAPALTMTNTETDPSSNSIQGTYFNDNAGLVEVNLPSLEEAFHLSVQDNPVLETLDVSSLNEVGSVGWVRIKKNPSFSSCDAQDIAETAGISGRIQICENYDDGCDESCDD